MARASPDRIIGGPDAQMNRYDPGSAVGFGNGVPTNGARRVLVDHSYSQHNNLIS